MERIGNKIVGTKGMELELALNGLALLGIYEPTDKMIQDIMETGEHIVDEPSTPNYMERAMDFQAKPEVKTETKAVAEDDFFDFEEDDNTETIGEYMSYVFTDDWNISKAQVRRGIAVEETALQFLSNGKCKMNKRTVSGPAISYLKMITSEIRPTVTGMDGKTYSSVITKEEGEVKIVRFTVMESTGDVTITYFLKKRNTLARERELAMWR